MNISNRNSNSNFANHIVIHWSLLKASMESLHKISHQRETICDKVMIFFAKLVWRCKSQDWAKFELQCQLLIFIYSNSKFKVTCKTRTLNADTSGHIPKRDRLKSLTLHSPFCLFMNKKILNLNGHPDYFGTYTLNKTIRCALKTFILTLKIATFRVGEAQVIIYAQRIRLSLIRLQLDTN